MPSHTCGTAHTAVESHQEIMAVLYDRRVEQVALKKAARKFGEPQTRVTKFTQVTQPRIHVASMIGTDT